jgi:hypothetical protein
LRGGGTAGLIDGGQKGLRAYAASIHRRGHRLALKNSLSGQHEVREGTGHDQAAVIGSGVEENNAVQRRARERALRIAGDGQLEDIRPQRTDPFDHRGTFRASAGSGQ